MGSMACDVLFRMPSARLYFCLLIVRYMLSDKIKGKSALKARTFLHVVRDKVHACYWYIGCLCNSAGYLQRDQIFLKPLHMASDSVYWVRDMAKFFTYKKHPVHRNSSAMVINMDFIVTDIKQTCLGQG